LNVLWSEEFERSTNGRPREFVQITPVVLHFRSLKVNANHIRLTPKRRYDANRETITSGWSNNKHFLRSISNRSLWFYIINLF
jgi:hypothetical protein